MIRSCCHHPQFWRLAGLVVVLYSKNVPFMAQSRSPPQCEGVRWDLAVGSGERTLGWSYCSWKNKPEVSSAQSCVEPRAVGWQKNTVHCVLYNSRKYVWPNKPVMIRTHKGPSAAYKAEKATFRWQSSTFTAIKTERKAALVSVGWPPGSVGSGASSRSADLSSHQIFDLSFSSSCSFFCHALFTVQEFQPEFPLLKHFNPWKQKRNIYKCRITQVFICSRLMLKTLPEQHKPDVQLARSLCVRRKHFLFTFWDSVWRRFKELWRIHCAQQMLFFLSGWRGPSSPGRLRVVSAYLPTQRALQLSNLSSNGSTGGRRNHCSVSFYSVRHIFCL